VLIVVIALAPVAGFLAALQLMDRFRLVRRPAVLSAMAAGAAAALVSLWLNQWLLAVHHVPRAIVSQYVAPIAEETAKAAFLVALLAAGRIGFLVEAAVHGFAVGTGFALVENLAYLGSMPDASPAVWVVRGLGTAVLQGATTMIFAMVSKTLADRQGGCRVLTLAPGWAAAVAIHSTFNHRMLPPLAQTLVLLVVLPLLVLWVFERSERATREWVGAGMDLDVTLLGLVTSQDFAEMPFGRYIQQLRGRMPGPAVADMYCLLRLELELAIQAKAMLLAREAGLDVPADKDLEAVLAERRYLRRSIGKVGLLVLKPLSITSDRDRWHRHVLQHRD
jgi:protease PrsW